MLGGRVTVYNMLCVLLFLISGSGQTIYICLGYSVDIMIHGSWGFVRHAGGMPDDVL